MSLPKVLCIVGPTSSGKTALGLALAKTFNGEIVNADARQLYRGFDIGTGKPSKVERQSVPHHLFEEDPHHPLTVTVWRERALKCIQKAIGRNRLPILVGGTGLYLQALIDNFSIPAVPPQVDLRAELETLSLKELVARLEEADPASVSKIDIKNPRRVLRALEVMLASGRSFADLRSRGEPLVDALQIGIQHSREELYARAEQAVDRMLEDGWLEEVRSLRESRLSSCQEAMSAIGYRELVDVIEGRLSSEGAVLKIKQATRNYIKRQITWFKRDTRIHWVRNEEEALEQIEFWLVERAN